MPSIGIVLTVYNEPLEMVSSQVATLKRVYPNADIILCYDAVDPLPIDGVVHVKFAQRLKTRASAGRWAHEWMKAFLEHSDGEYMLKLDPDTGIIKPIEFWPQGEVIFGTVLDFDIGGGSRIFLIHGGGVGYSRSMVQRFVDNEWLLSNRFVNNICFQDQEDIIISRLVLENKLTYVDHPEIANGMHRTQNASTSIRHP